jgi:hypothetical protein
VIQPLDRLLLEYSDDDWNNIRSESITLIGEHVNITLRTITQEKNIFDGSQTYIRLLMSRDKNSI